MTKKIWMKISDDEFELPEYVAFNIIDLAVHEDKSIKAIRSSFDDFKAGRKTKTRYIAVDTDI